MSKSGDNAITAAEASPTTPCQGDGQGGKKKKKGFFRFFKFGRGKSSDKCDASADTSHKKKFSFGFLRKSNRTVKTETKTHKNKKIKGTVLIEETSNKDMWQKIIDNSIVGTGVITKAAICSISTGGIYAHNPPDFTPTVEQLTTLCNAASNPKQLTSCSIFVADECYKFVSGVPEQSIFAVQQETVQSDSGPPNRSGLLIFFGKTSMLIAVYEKDQDGAKKLCTELLEYFYSQLNF